MMTDKYVVSAIATYTLRLMDLGHFIWFFVSPVIICRETRCSSLSLHSLVLLTSNQQIHLYWKHPAGKKRHDAIQRNIWKTLNLKPWFIHFWQFNEFKKSFAIIHNLYSCCNVTLSLRALSGVSSRPCDTWAHTRVVAGWVKPATFCDVSNTTSGWFHKNYSEGNKNHVVIEIFILLCRRWVIYQ